MKENKKEEKNNKQKLPGWAIALIICVIVGVVIYFGFIFAVFGLAIFADAKIEFEDKGNNTYYVEKLNTTITETSAEYSEENDCYILTLKVDKLKDSKKKFMETDELTISYDMYDEEGYLLGNADGIISKFSEQNKWKVKVEYCDIDAKNVESYKLSTITNY